MQSRIMDPTMVLSVSVMACHSGIAQHSLHLLFDQKGPGRRTRLRSQPAVRCLGANVSGWKGFKCLAILRTLMLKKPVYY